MMFIIDKNKKAIIKGVEIDTVNGYEIIKKDDGLYLDINNEVFTDESYKLFLEMIRAEIKKGDLYEIILEDEIVDTERKKDIVKTHYICKITEGTLFKVNYKKPGVTLPLFKIIDMHYE